MMMMMFPTKLLCRPRGPILGYSMYIYSRRGVWAERFLARILRACRCLLRSALMVGGTSAIQPRLPPYTVALFSFPLQSTHVAQK